ncbi:MAG: ROK family protein [Limisphaerales bacterium]
MAKRAAIGIDIGGTKTLCALVSDRFEILQQVKFLTSPEEGRREFSKSLTAAATALAREAHKRELRLVGIGIASAGRVDRKHCTITSSPNILWLEGFRVGAILKKAVKLESVIGNDVQLALYGEQQLGIAAGCSQVLGVFFGTGVGGAAIVNGRIYRGASGAGGNVGATLTHQIGGVDGLESHGMLDRIASKGAIAGAAIGMGLKQWAPHLYKEVGTDISKVTWGSIARARKSGDKKVEELIRSRLRVAGIALSSIVNFLNPEMLVLGGGLTEELPRLVVSGVERGLREYLTPEVSRKLKIRAAKFGNKAGVIGAARLAFKKLS